jgi:hypothetical protein
MPTTRVYLQGARVTDGPPRQDDLPAERFFVPASDLQEVWVETESGAVPDVGRPVTFALVRSLGVGFERIEGTVERKQAKGPRPPVT